MRFVRVEVGGEPRHGELTAGGVRLWSAAPWAGGRATGECVPTAHARLLAPVRPSKIVGVGRNYLDHIREMGYPVPQQPTVFLKPPSALVDPEGEVVLPPAAVSGEVAHEAELGVVIGRRASRVPRHAAAAHVFGYTCANDVSARDLQRSDPTLARGKGWDTFCPVGPWVETELDPARGVDVECWVNGVRRQHGTTADMVFDVATIVAYVSAFMTLCPGDLLLTGSPGGSARLEHGDRVEIRVEGLGALRHTVRADPADLPADGRTSGEG